ncbi:MAG: hypothetical protein L0387_17590 [Acidobacteria bacterium]|nr:hypothetical protein [Acidobacteriota bacterium]
MGRWGLLNQGLCYALNESVPTTVTVTTPPSGAVDPRRVGVRPTGAYWGALGEQIDLLSGNLNFSVPMLQARSRGFAVPFRLSYNSQLWKLDSGAHWQLGTDVGFGYGWKLLAGSLRAYHKNWVEIHHWTFTDATGAEYRLDVNTNNVWTSREALYLSVLRRQPAAALFPRWQLLGFRLCVSRKRARHRNPLSHAHSR